MKSVYLLYAAAGAALLVLFGIYEKWQASQVFNGAPVGSTESAFNLPPDAFAPFAITLRNPGVATSVDYVDMSNGLKG